VKLSVSGLDLVTDAGYPVGPRFIMGGRPPAIGFGPYKTIEEAEEARVEWEAYINERREGKSLRKSKTYRKKNASPL
jgi:hypothetical protein